jgi:hypothetical protein
MRMSSHSRSKQGNVHPESRSLSHILAVLNTTRKVVKSHIIRIHWTYLIPIPILENLVILLFPRTSQRWHHQEYKWCVAALRSQGILHPLILRIDYPILFVL